jgi:hypothetical protein
MSLAREELPGSPSQRHRLELLSRTGPTGNLGHCLTVGIELTGALDLVELRARLVGLIRRRPALSAVFGADGTHTVQDLPAELVHVRAPGADPDQRWQAAQDLAAAESARPFRPDAGARLRLTAVTAEPWHHFVILAVDPLVCDAWSVNHLVDDLLAPGDAPQDDDGYPRTWRNRQEWLAGAQGRAAIERRRAAVAGSWQRWPLPAAGGTADDGGTERYLAVAERTSAALQVKVRAERSTVLAVTAAALVICSVDAGAGYWGAAEGATGDPPLALRSTFAAREGPDEWTAVGAFATDVVLCLPRRSGTIAEYLRLLRAEVFHALADQRVPGELVESGLARGIASGPTCALVYLPKDLSGGRQAGRRLGGAEATRTAVSICPTGADLDLFVVEGAPPMRSVPPAELTLGATSWCGHLPRQLEDLLDRWATTLDLLVHTDWATDVRDLVAALPPGPPVPGERTRDGSA